jgi:hypothetical protein
MATAAEIKAKIEKAKSNKFLPEPMRAKIVSKYEAELAELEKTPARKQRPDQVETKDGMMLFRKDPELKEHIFYDKKGVGYECLGYKEKLDDCVFLNLETKKEVVGCVDGFYYENPVKKAKKPSKKKPTIKEIIKMQEEGKLNIGDSLKKAYKIEGYAEYEGKVFEEIEKQADMTRSDAQGVAMSYVEHITKNLNKKISPAITASQILEKSEVKPTKEKSKKEEKMIN